MTNFQEIGMAGLSRIEGGTSPFLYLLLGAQRMLSFSERQSGLGEE